MYERPIRDVINNLIYWQRNADDVPVNRGRYVNDQLRMESRPVDEWPNRIQCHRYRKGMGADEYLYQRSVNTLLTIYQ